MVKRKSSKQRAWTKTELDRLRSLAKRKMSAASIARTLRRSLNSTKKKASRLRVPLGALERWTNGDLRRLKSLARQKRPLPYIAKTLRRTVSAVEKAASNHGISLDFR